MTPIPIDVIGTIAATLTTGSFGLQAMHTLKSRDVSGISLGMYVVYVFGVVLWVAYGVMLNAVPMISSQVITLTFASIILVMKIRDLNQARPFGAEMNFGIHED